MSGGRNPDDLRSILPSLSPSLSRTFRDLWFFFRGIHVSEIHFRELPRKILKRTPSFPTKHILKHLFPTCQVRVSRFYQSCVPPIASSSSSSSFTLRPQPRAPDLSGHCRTSTATARPHSGHCRTSTAKLRPPDLSQTPRAPDLSGHCHSLTYQIAEGGPFQLVRAFADLSRSFRRVSGHIYRNL